MSTFFIYPLDGTHGKEETSLGSNGLSRILEIPLSLLDADTNELFNNKNATDQLFWLSTNNTAPTPTLPSCETNASATTVDVTHSFANRKRSIVKRRKSVLSASFTAQDEAEAIKSDREATLAALERGTPMQHCNEEDSIKDNIMIEDTEIEAAPVKGGNTDTTARGVNAVEPNTIYIQPKEEEQEQTVTAKDSAIDLRATALEQDKSAFTEEEDTPMKEPISSSFPPSPTLTPVVTMTTTTATTTATKKKVSSWSPRRIFSSAKNKDPSGKQQDKFHLSSLFSRGSPKTKNHSNPAKSVLLHPEQQLQQQEEKGEFQLKSHFNYTRLPIHTERAIYRLSHMKLTNPRRPLCDQVTISNLMFWYLSIISQQNHETTPPSLSIDSIVLTKKACHIQIHHSRRQSKKRSSSNKRIRNHQIGPDHSPGGGTGNAMDALQKQRHLYRNTQLRTSNSSSDDEEDDEDSFSEEEEEEEDLFAHSKTSHNKTKRRQQQKNNNSWLSTFSPKQHAVSRQDEDDIPLAMYQKGKA
ncbi:uncharacterized protein EV154DRAFT_603889 [Mucor mucedo]|uniref:uncharacterized protein n=1 Tax=Mucor mucedo TaxID=29922 RepID=UPI00221FD414|nr:uncharacterized protein EV154DRAFT_603889 [Mucor mucedo]KAI7889546.1 hypothetical protein EV154DRAFT_603889 [Mucor mucedo]